MEWSSMLISLNRLKIKWPKLHFEKKPVNIRKILALQESQMKMVEFRIVLDEIMRSHRLL